MKTKALSSVEIVHRYLNNFNNTIGLKCSGWLLIHSKCHSIYTRSHLELFMSKAHGTR